MCSSQNITIVYKRCSAIESSKVKKSCHPRIFIRLSLFSTADNSIIFTQILMNKSLKNWFDLPNDSRRRIRFTATCIYILYDRRKIKWNNVFVTLIISKTVDIEFKYKFALMTLINALTTLTSSGRCSTW